MSRAEWMNGICLTWSRGRLISPSLPVGDDRYLNLSSQKRPTGRNLGGNRLVRCSGTTSRELQKCFSRVPSYRRRDNLLGSGDKAKNEQLGTKIVVDSGYSSLSTGS
ncbi:hypothetical protein P5673_006800 [Acropora cervicornis]|uniref:Uncharacterized protein n=1 Tax=Acropora cervicornis TaxID=6130 RepID=A0AAD9QWF9_ACRCE|nr:hypothetical protein P5673_006800 [Acropora cervicornis]